MGDNKVRAGFAKVDITPPLGVGLAGYFNERLADDILDPLYASALALSNKEDTIVIMSCDFIGLGTNYADRARELISEKLEIPVENIMIHSTHTHTGPIVRDNARERGKFAISKKDEPYLEMLLRKLCDAAYLATNRMSAAKFEIGYGSEDGISFIRRYKMKDGSIRTNPGVGNPDIVEPIGNINPTVGVIRIALDDGGEVLVVNFALHPDIIGGCGISADYPGHMRAAIKRQLPNSDVIFLNGAAGDINHIDAMHLGNTSRGYKYSTEVGNTLAAEVFKVLQKLESYDGPMDIKAMTKTLKVPHRRVSQEERDEAYEMVKAFHSGEWKTKDMGGVTVIARAYQTLSLAEKPDERDVEIQVLSIGGIIFAGLPGEVFSDIGRRIQENSPLEHTFIASLVNGSNGYFPTEKAFGEGGYETSNNPFTPELEGILVNGFVQIFSDLF